MRLVAVRPLATAAVDGTPSAGGRARASSMLAAAVRSHIVRHAAGPARRTFAAGSVDMFEAVEFAADGDGIA